MKPFYLLALLLGLGAIWQPSLATGQTLSPEDAFALAKKTGKPILAMAGRES